MIYQSEIKLPSYRRGFHLITEIILKEISSQLPEKGLLNIFILHTSAGLTVSENYDPAVRNDFETIFSNLIPENLSTYTHNAEGPDDMPSHVKSALVGSSVNIPITNHKLNLGTWQGIYLCEFRNSPHQRKIVVTVYS